ncbi:uncharacterized protein A4U43_C03F11570 [Asparagus officinalis]|uniref:Small ribosomal subunit protein uS5c n=1 Tax=Asparagus officinalis TaxID=4686 RepID=A0A5P1FEE3_ASPOF|nr:uncharacterized protein A4U43_C03F11570 [Asparagus officinalis]
MRTFWLKGDCDGQKLKFVLEKQLTKSDVSSVGRILLPKKQAEAELPILEDKWGISLTVRDALSCEKWTMRYRYWPNKYSKIYVLENTGDFIRKNNLKPGDFIAIYQDNRKKNFVCARKTERPPFPLELIATDEEEDGRDNSQTAVQSYDYSASSPGNITVASDPASSSADIAPVGDHATEPIVKPWDSWDHGSGDSWTDGFGVDHNLMDFYNCNHTQYRRLLSFDDRDLSLFDFSRPEEDDTETSRASEYMQKLNRPAFPKTAKIAEHKAPPPPPPPHSPSNPTSPWPHSPPSPPSPPLYLSLPSPLSSSSFPCPPSLTLKPKPLPSLTLNPTRAQPPTSTPPLRQRGPQPSSIPSHPPSPPEGYTPPPSFDELPPESEDEIAAAYEEIYGPAYSGFSVLGNDVYVMDSKVKKSSGSGLGRKKREKANDGFDERVVQVRRVTKVVKGGKNMSFRAVVVVGDKKGRVGVGVGKAKEIVDAIAKSAANARRNIIAVPMTKYLTFPHRADGDYGAAKVMLRPASPGTGVIAGGAVRIVLEMAGVENALGKQLGSDNALNNARATLVAVQKMRQFRDVARERGIPMEELWK